MAASTAEAEATFIRIVAAYMDALENDYPSIIARLDAVVENYTGISPSVMGSVANQIRQASASTQQAFRRMFDQAILEWLQSSGVDAAALGGRSVGANHFLLLRQYLGDDGPYSGGSVDKYVADRGWTRDASDPALSGHKIYRVLEDEYGNALQAGTPEKKTWEALTGVANSEKRIRVVGEIGGRDVFELSGSNAALVAASFDDVTTRNIVKNENLVANAGGADGAAVAAVSNWTLGGSSTHAWEYDDGTSWRSILLNLQTAQDGDFVQQLLDFNFRPGQLRVPYLPYAWIDATDLAGTGEGVTLRWGSKSQAFFGLSDGVQLIVPDRDADLFPVNWLTGANANRIRLELAAGAGTLNVFKIGIAPAVLIDGTWYFVLTDTTDPVPGTTAETEDTLSVSGLNPSHALAMAYRGSNLEAAAYLPTSGSNQIATPT